MVLHMDATCDEDGGVYGYGGLIRNGQGDVVAAMHGCYPSLLSPLCAETRAVLKGLRLAKENDILELALISDSLSLISMLNGCVHGEAEAHALLWDIAKIKKSF